MRQIKNASRWIAILSWEVRVGLIEKLSFEKNLEGSEGMSHIDKQGESILDKGNSQCKDPVVGEWIYS